MSKCFGKRNLHQSSPELKNTLPSRKRSNLFICSTLTAALLAAGVALHVAKSANQDKNGPSGETGSTTSSHVLPPAPEVQNSYAAAKIQSEPVVMPELLCKHRYPLDYNMRDVCVRSQEEAELAAENMQIDQDVGVLCAKRYPDDWTYYVICAKEQMFAKYPARVQPTRPDYDIIDQCRTEWPHDYNMEEYCIKEQEDARYRAQGGWIDSKIAAKCTNDYPTNWNMFMYCVDRQTNAKNRIR